MKALELADEIEQSLKYQIKHGRRISELERDVPLAAAELRRLAEVNAELLGALEGVCKEFDVFNFPLNGSDMSQAAFVSIRASDAIAKAKEQQ